MTLTSERIAEIEKADWPHASPAAAPKPAVEAEPTYWAVWSVTGMYIGCWDDDDRATAERVFADDYPDGRIEALYTSPPSATGTRNAALEEAAKWHDGEATATRSLAIGFNEHDAGSDDAIKAWVQSQVHERSAEAIRALIDNTEGSEGANG